MNTRKPTKEFTLKIYLVFPHFSGKEYAYIAHFTAPQALRKFATHAMIDFDEIADDYDIQEVPEPLWDAISVEIGIPIRVLTLREILDEYGHDPQTLYGS